MGGTAGRGTAETAGAGPSQGRVYFGKSPPSCTPVICTLDISICTFSTGVLKFCHYHSAYRVPRAGLPGSWVTGISRERLIFAEFPGPGWPSPRPGLSEHPRLSKGCKAAGNRSGMGVGEDGRRYREAPFSPEATSPEETPGVLLHVNGLLSGGIARRNGLPRKPLQGHFMCFSHRLSRGPEKDPCTVIRWAGRGDIPDPTQEVNRGPRTHAWAQTGLSG